MRDQQIEIILDQLLAFLTRLQTFKFFLKYVPLDNIDSKAFKSINGCIQMVEQCITVFSTTEGFIEQENSNTAKLLMQWCINTLDDQDCRVDNFTPQENAIFAFLKKLTTESRGILKQMKKRDKK